MVLVYLVEDTLTLHCKRSILISVFIFVFLWSTSSGHAPWGQPTEIYGKDELETGRDETIRTI